MVLYEVVEKVPQQFYLNLRPLARRERLRKYLESIKPFAC